MGSRKDTNVTVPRYLTTRQAAEYLGVQPNTLRVWRVSGRGPKYSKTETGRILYAAADLATWLAAHARDRRDK
jgi:DNA-binding transcriptional MerR regulator